MYRPPQPSLYTNTPGKIRIEANYAVSELCHMHILLRVIEHTRYSCSNSMVNNNKISGIMRFLPKGMQKE